MPNALKKLVIEWDAEDYVIKSEYFVPVSDKIKSEIRIFINLMIENINYGISEKQNTEVNYGTTH